MRFANDIISEAEGLLQTATFGLEDMKTRPGRAKTGLRNAVVFGRMTTFALQNLRGATSEFEIWYAKKQADMKADPLMRFFHDLRTTIEKKAHTPTTVDVHIRSFSDKDVGRLEPRPPGATACFVGDQNGGSGWVVRQSDGTEEKYYVELPGEIGQVQLRLQGAPPVDGVSNPTATLLVEEYLSKVGALVREARELYGHPVS